MIDVQTALAQILSATYGKDIRNAIHDAIFQMDKNANEAVDLAQIKFGNEVISPTSPVTGFIEGNVYFNTSTGIIWKLRGGAWQKLGSMKSIKSISKTSTSGLNDTYTILYSDETFDTYMVTNGEKGVSITNITKTSTSGNVDHYDINLSDGTTTPNGIDISNGVSVSDITLASTVGNTKNYDVNLSDGTKTPNGFSVTDGTSNYVHIRYSANFDGTGMVSVPSSTTVYIGIVVTTQATAPTDPAVYSWVKFIGDSGTGTGDMLKSEYATKYAGVVDKAAALFDGSKEVLANELLDKTTYASKGVAGTVDKAVELVDVTNSKIADTVLLANLTDDGTGLKYKGNEIGGKVAIDDVTIKEGSDGKLKVADTITAKLPAQAPTSADEGKAPVVQNDGSVAWGEVKGGHEMLSDIPSVISNTEENKVVDALVVKEFSNTYKVRLIQSFDAEAIGVGTWCENPTWTSGDMADWISSDELIQEDKDVSVEFQFMFEVENGEPLALGGYQWDSTSGKMCVKFGNQPTANGRIAIDIIKIRG